MKFIEAQNLTVLQQLVEGAGQGIILMAVLEHALVQVGKKIMKMQATLVRLWQCVKEPIEQPAFASSNLAMQIQTASLAAVDTSSLFAKVFDDLQLTLTQGETLGSSLVTKILTNGCRQAGRASGCRREAMAQGA